MSARGDAGLPLHAALGLLEAGELVSIVGGGGKTALLFALAERAPDGARWVLTTTTRIFASQIALAREHTTDDADALAARLDAGAPGLLVYGAIDGDKAVGVRPDLPARILAHPRVDGVAVEADGSRRLPAKAPAEHEPVVADGTTTLVVVAGIDALEGTIAERTHRPERVARLVSRGTDERLDPAGLAALLAHEEGGLKGAPPGARVAVLLNKVERADQRAAARETAAHLARAPRIERVLVGALRERDGRFETRVRD